MYACHTCPRDERNARRCPIPPLEWEALEKAGVRFEGHDAQAISDGLMEQLEKRREVWPRVLQSQVTEEAELLNLRALLERKSGKSFGEEQEGLCAWYKASRDPATMTALSMVSMDDQGRLDHWVAGGRWEQPAWLLDAADVIRSEGNRITAEELQAARDGSSGGGDGGEGDGEGWG